MITQRLQKNWLIVTAIVIAGFGPVFTLGATLATSGAAALTLDLLAWPIDGTQSFTDATTRFLSALTGGFLMGWGVMVLCLRAWVFDLAPEQTRRIVLVGLCAWFLFDSGGSLLAGQPSNALINVGVLTLAAGPLWFRVRANAAEQD